MNKNYNFNSGFCNGKDCETYVYKGDGVRLYSNGGWRTFCVDCAEKEKFKNKAIRANVKKAKIKKAYLDSQPTLFDNLEGDN